MLPVQQLTKMQAMISAGSPLGAVADWFGVDQSYISQLFDQEILTRPLENSRDDKWNKIEDKLLDKLQEFVPSISSPKAIVSILQMSNKAVRRGKTDDDFAKSNAKSNTVINIVIPERIQKKVTFNATSGAITTIEGNPMLTATKEQLPTFIENKEATANTYL